MKTKSILFIVALALLAGSCIPSLFPLYTEDDIIFDSRIEGIWDAGIGYIGIWTIERLEHHSGFDFMNPSWTEPDEDTDPGNIKYRLTIRQLVGTDTVEAEFLMHLLNLGDYMYMNIHPQDYELHHGFLSWHMIEANTFMRINIQKDSFDIRAFDPGFLENLIEENKIRIDHMSFGGILLTAPTKDLQKFVLKYSDEEGALFEPDVLHKIGPVPGSLSDFRLSISAGSL
jgi:hypothetical protein